METDERGKRSKRERERERERKREREKVRNNGQNVKGTGKNLSDINLRAFKLYEKERKKNR